MKWFIVGTGDKKSGLRTLTCGQTVNTDTEAEAREKTCVERIESIRPIADGESPSLLQCFCRS